MNQQELVTNGDVVEARYPSLLSPLRWLWERRNIRERLTIALLAARVTSKARRVRQIRQRTGGKTTWTMNVDTLLERHPELCHDDATWPIGQAKWLEFVVDNLLRSAP